jgi:hypothetical protein
MTGKCDEIIRQLGAVYIVGYPTIVAFDILIPISYVLVLALLILAVKQSREVIIWASSAIVAVICVLMESYNNPVYNLNMVSSGIIGMGFGLLTGVCINKFVGSPRKLVLAAVLYGVCAIQFGDKYITQIMATVVSLTIIHGVAIRTGSGTWIAKQVMTLGRYSLVSYISQILFLKVLNIGPRISDDGWVSEATKVLLVVTTCTVVTLAIALVIDHGRAKNRLVRGLYKLIFG